MSNFLDILNKDNFTKEDIILLLNSENLDKEALLTKANQVKEKFVGNKVYFRGLIEYSNVCAKNCFYCGVRRDNKSYDRYQMTDEEVIECALFAWKNNYASIVIQAGERNDTQFVDNISRLLKEIHLQTNNELRITLSLGEQTEETYKKWFDAGAKRYLIRIETSNPELYKLIHPDDKKHSFEDRIKSLDNLKKIGYQVGTGVMIGLPFQTINDLANDILFFREKDLHMFGMGPYVEHTETPLYKYSEKLLSKQERFELSLKMVAVLRITMKNINIAATTAMQTLDPMGREKAIKAGANIIMPNLTPIKYREDYLLYEGKPCLDEDAAKCQNCISMRIASTGNTVGFGEWGDSKHFNNLTPL